MEVMETPMTSHAKITVIGGSSSATPALIAALAALGAQLPPLELALVGRNAQRLALVADVARRLIAGRGLPWTVSATTELERALGGSRFVINQVRVGGMQARDYDESFPLAHGLPGDETAGPGGLANALRSLPAYLAYAQAVEREAPDATILQLSNPANPAVTLLRRQTRVATLGFCDQPVTTLAKIAALLGLPEGSVTVDYGGLNHLGFVLRVRHGERDLTAEALELVASEQAMGIAPDVVRALGVIPTPYLRVLYHGDEVAAAQRAKTRSRASELLALEESLFAAYGDAAQAEQAALRDERGAGKWYQGVLAPLLAALLGVAPRELILIMANNGTLSDLPSDATVEAATMVDAAGLTPRPLGPLPPTIRGLIQAASAHEELVLAAALDPCERTVLAALLGDPLVRSASTARSLVGPVLRGLAL